MYPLQGLECTHEEWVALASGDTTWFEETPNQLIKLHLLDTSAEVGGQSRCELF